MRQLSLWDIGVRLFPRFKRPLLGMTVKANEQPPTGNRPFDNECNDRYRKAREGFHWLPEHDS